MVDDPNTVVSEQQIKPDVKRVVVIDDFVFLEDVARQEYFEKQVDHYNYVDELDLLVFLVF